jgi:hypothetical protein
MKFYVLLLPFCLLLSPELQAQVNPPDSSGVNDTIFKEVEVEASFPGGDEAWKGYLQRKLDPQVPIYNKAPLGLYTIVARFVVDHSGNLTDIQTENNPGYGMEKEVIRIIKGSGRWHPAMQNGKPVNAYRRQPISFLVEDDDFSIYSKDKYSIIAGMDNELSVVIKKVKNEDIRLTISQGTITPSGDGKFIARVNEAGGRVIVTAYSIRKNKELGKESFEVKVKDD